LKRRMEVQKVERKENRGDGRFIQRMYMCNIADIILNGSDICSTADISGLSAIPIRRMIP